MVFTPSWLSTQARVIYAGVALWRWLALARAQVSEIKAAAPPIAVYVPNVASTPHYDWRRSTLGIRPRQRSDIVAGAVDKG